MIDYSLLHLRLIKIISVLRMNFIAATVELKDLIGDPINAYGLNYCGANAVVPANGSASEVRFRVLCYDRQGPKLQSFLRLETWNTSVNHWQHCFL